MAGASTISTGTTGRSSGWTRARSPADGAVAPADRVPAPGRLRARVAPFPALGVVPLRVALGSQYDAEVAARVEQRDALSPVHLAPQAAHVNIDQVGHRIVLVVPDVRRDLRAA